MEKFGECEEAASSVIGVVLLAGMIVVVVSTIALSVLAFEPLKPAPEARIVAAEASGDIDGGLYKNFIVLKHKGGDALDKKKIKIILIGRGCAYIGNSSSCFIQDIHVTYRDLSGNNYGGENGANLGEIVDGITWDPGETIKLYGSDGKNINSQITDNQNNTVDNKWRLEEGSKVLITIIDTATNQIIATTQATVKRA